MSVDSDAAHEEVYSPGLGDLVLIIHALFHGVLSHAVQHVDVVRGNVDVVEEIVVHEIPVALFVLTRQSHVFVHVERDNIAEGHLARLVHLNEFLIDADRRGSCGKAQNERPESPV